MTVNLIKMSVGVEDIHHLERKQEQRLSDSKIRGENSELIHITRNTPRRATEVLQGGSIYWVIKRFIQVRQLIIDIRQVEEYKGRKSCALILKPELIRTEIKRIRAFQGWRYFSVDDAPEDLSALMTSGGDAPIELVETLKVLGLL